MIISKRNRVVGGDKTGVKPDGQLRVRSYLRRINQ